jgi:hypothetical protein
MFQYLSDWDMHISILNDLLNDCHGKFRSYDHCQVCINKEMQQRSWLNCMAQYIATCRKIYYEVNISYKIYEAFFELQNVFIYK